MNIINLSGVKKKYYSLIIFADWITMAMDHVIVSHRKQKYDVIPDFGLNRNQVSLFVVDHVGLQVTGCLQRLFVMGKEIFMKLIGKKWVVMVLTLICCLVSVGAWASDVKPKNGEREDTPMKQTIVLNDRSWDSIQVHNRIAGFILEHGYGYSVEYMFANSMASLTGLGKGDIDVLMEMWIQTNIDGYTKLTESGKIVDLGPNFVNAPSGWYIPTYMVKGDPKRGIKPVAPDLKTVKDLARYWELFKDPEVPGKGRFYNNPSSWALTYGINETKIHTYGLAPYYNVFDSGSEMALVTSMVSAYENGEPWLGYFWEPTWVMGKLDMTMIDEPEYNSKRWVKGDYGCAWAAENVTICVNSKLVNTNPDVILFLKKYETSVAMTSSILAYMKESSSSSEEAAIWFLRKYPDVWHKWIPADIMKNVENAL